MCVLKLGTNAEVYSLNNEKNIKNTNERVVKINALLEQLEK
jgi:cell division protein ZapA